MDAMGPWDCEDLGKYSRKEVETLVPSATMLSAAMTVRMATSPDFLFCDESPILGSCLTCHFPLVVVSAI